MNILEFYIPEWFFVALSLVILVVVLRRFFWNPLLRILDTRKERIEQAERDALEVAAQKDGLEKEIAKTATDLEQMKLGKIKEARTLAGQEYDRIVEEAESKARLIIDHAQAQAKQEHGSMLHNATEEILKAALAATGQLLEANMSSERNERLIRAFIAKRSTAR